MIVIPMVGASSRFFKAGYDKPKYQLPLWGETVFFWVMKSFSNYFHAQEFLFILRDEYEAEKFVRKEVDRLGIDKYNIVVLADMTQGQADTVAQGIKSKSDNCSITIFNIDTIRYNFDFPDFVSDCAGYLEVFKGHGDHWSFVEPNTSGGVIRTTEKERISDLCSNGLYHFSSASDFLLSFNRAVERDEKSKGEYYIAPLYNDMVANGFSVRYSLISAQSMDFCGTPEEYENLIKRGNPRG